jgi:hypothetical protein
MDDKRQNNQLVLAVLEEDRGEAPKISEEGIESSAGKAPAGKQPDQLNREEIRALLDASLEEMR